MAERFELHPNSISQWEQEFIGGCGEQVIEARKSPQVSAPNFGQVMEVEAKELYAKIGRLQMERDFLKKSLAKWDQLK